MNLYLVVHHQQDFDQKWINNWLDDERLDTITTPSVIGEFCINAMQKGERVFIHRCGWENALPVVCCSAKVIQSAEIDEKTSPVKFGDHQVLGIKPPENAFPGLNSYWA